MRRNTRHALLILCLLSGCGLTSATPTPHLSLRFEGAALKSQAQTLLIYLYSNNQTCSLLAATMPRPSPNQGPYQAALTNAYSQNGVTFTLSTLPVGIYTILIDALDAQGQKIGSGCTDTKAVDDQKLTQVNIVIS